MLKCSRVGFSLWCSKSQSLSTQCLGFITNHSNLIKKCWRELYKALNVFSLCTHSAASKGGGKEVFILVPQKLAVILNQSKPVPPVFQTGPFGFPELAVRGLNQNWSLRFGKPVTPVFPVSKTLVFHVAIVFLSSHLGFSLSIETLNADHVASLLIERHA